MTRTSRRRFLKTGLGAALALPLFEGKMASALAACDPTPPNTAGPYWRKGAPFTEKFLVDDGGDPLFVMGRVTSTETCQAIEGVVLDIWHANHLGKYDVDYENHDLDVFKMRGRLETGPDGLFRFQTIVPAAYPFGGSARRPAHIHYKISAPGYEPLTTQMYFAGDPYLDKDPIRNVRDSLIVDLEEHKDGKKMGAPQVKQRCFRGVFDVALIPESKV